MEPKTPQLSAYDLLGYLVPGLSLIALVDLSIAYHLHLVRLDYGAILAHYKDVPWNSAIPLLLLAYYLGHVVSFMSSYTVERHAQWLYGQPSKLLLGEQRGKYFSPPLNFNHPIQLAIAIFVLPVSLLEFIARFLGIDGNYFKPFDKLVLDMVNKAYADLFSRSSIDFDKYPARDFRTYDYERLGLHYALESAPAHLYSMRNYIVLYGFLRAMSFILIMVTWVSLFHCLRNTTFLNSILVYVALSSFTFVSYAAYLKFWFRYHRESLMAVTAVFLKSTKDAENRKPND